MSIKVTVDNNFFDSFDNLDEAKKSKIIGAFKSQQLSLYVTPELITELLGLYKTTRKELLPKFIGYLFDMMGYQIFNEWGKIIRIELGIIRDERIFAGSDLMKNVKIILSNIIGGKESPDDIESLLNTIKVDKDNKYKQFKDNQDHHFQLFKAKSMKIPKWDFETFYSQDFVIKIRRDLIKDILERGGIEATEHIIDRYFDNKRVYPYFHISNRVFMAIFHRHVMRGLRVDEGDSYDQYHLIYAATADHLITEDKRLQEFGADVFQSENKVISLCKLLEIVEKVS